jgi:flap endonuclease-1
MGIRHLNSYLRDNCPNSIQPIHLRKISGKKIVVDISIYLYRYEAENALLENMYLMLSILSYYNIIPIFIFDGKPPPEKQQLLQQRKLDRKNALNQYDILQHKLDTETLECDEKRNVLATMDALKKQSVQLKKDKIDRVKQLIQAYGAMWYDAPREADEICALLVIKQKVWACLSEDMDLFVYGCNRVLRYFNLSSHRVVLYQTQGILRELNMSQNEFKQVCIVSGTDYNLNTLPHINNLNQTLINFKKFKESSDCVDFYDWIRQYSTCDVSYLKYISEMFNVDHIDGFSEIHVNKTEKNRVKIEEIMKSEKFIFIV